MRTPRVVLAAVLAAAVAGCASAAGPAVTTAVTAPAGTARLTAWSVNSDGPHFQAVLTGAVGDYGPAVAIRPDGPAGRGQGSELQLNLSRGAFRLSIAKIESELARALGRWRYDQATCSVHVKVTGRVPVVAGSGTGAYRGIAGTFTLTITINEVDERQPACNGHAAGGQPAFLSQIIVVAGTGSVGDDHRP